MYGDYIFLEKIYLKLSSKEEENKIEKDTLDKLKTMADKGVVKCGNCNGDHWTSKCPYKGKVPDDKKPLVNTGISDVITELKPQDGKYEPGIRDGGNNRGDSMQVQRRDDTTAIRISNLSQSTTDADLDELVKPFGSVVKRYLAKEKLSKGPKRLCKGFAYVHFKHRADAARAIATLNGYSYEHLILRVEWTKPQVQNN